MKKCTAVLLGILGMAATLSAGDIPVKTGDKVAFLGDSITRFGNDADGYLTMTMEGLSAIGIEAKKIPVGVGGNTSGDMLRRIERDVLSKKPQFMVLSCGVNDVWHQFKKPPAGMTKAEYEEGVLNGFRKNVTEILDKAAATNIKVIVMTATMISENLLDSNNIKLADYNKFLRETAAARGCILVDQGLAMQQAVAAYQKRFPRQKQNYLTTDGVHMNALGNKLMALTLLKGLGLDTAQMTRATAAIDALKINMSVTVRISDYEFLSGKALEKNLPLNDYAGELFKEPLNKIGVK